MYILKDNKVLDITVAKKEDAPKLLDYLCAVGSESDNLLIDSDGIGMSISEEVEYIVTMQSSDNCALFIGRIDDEIVTVGSVTSSRRQRIAHHAELALSVKKAYWGLGIGSCMMQKIINFSRSNNITEILHLGVKADNLAAINLYKKMGFVQIGRFNNFFKIDGKYHDELLMNLIL